LRNRTKLLYYWNEEIRQLVKEEKKIIWNGLVQKIHRRGQSLKGCKKKFVKW
jgi:hypothetical protein